MDLSNLKPAEGSIKNRKRIGRGQGSGRGGSYCSTKRARFYTNKYTPYI